MSASRVADGLADRMRWLQSRTRVLSDNIANADTPRFRPRDLQPAARRQGSLATTQPGHIGRPDKSKPATMVSASFETRPNGNGVNLEDEMLKLSETQLEYQMLAGLYQKSLLRIRTAIGKRG